MKGEVQKGKDVMDRAKLSFIPCVGNLRDFLLEKILHFSDVTLGYGSGPHTLASTHSALKLVAAIGSGLQLWWAIENSEPTSNETFEELRGEGHVPAGLG